MREDTIFNKKPHYELHHKDERFDEITMRLQERWKESELSGDEWRFTVIVEVKRKGKVLASTGFHDFHSMLLLFPGWIVRSGDDGKFAIPDNVKEACFQPGCRNEPTVEYRMKKIYSDNGMFSSDPIFQDTRRCFCEEHAERGDCGLDDADANYERIESAEK